MYVKRVDQVSLGPELGKQNVQAKEAYYAAYLPNLHYDHVSGMLPRYHVKKLFLFFFSIVVRR